MLLDKLKNTKRTIILGERVELKKDFNIFIHLSYIDDDKWVYLSCSCFA